MENFRSILGYCSVDQNCFGDKFGFSSVMFGRQLNEFVTANLFDAIVLNHPIKRQ